SFVRELERIFILRSVEVSNRQIDQHVFRFRTVGPGRLKRADRLLILFLSLINLAQLAISLGQDCFVLSLCSSKISGESLCFRSLKVFLKIGRAHVLTPVTSLTRIPSSA